MNYFVLVCQESYAFISRTCYMRDTCDMSILINIVDTRSNFLTFPDITKCENLYILHYIIASIFVSFCTKYIVVICSCNLRNIRCLISEAFICHYTCVSYYCTLLLALMHLACYYNHVTASFNLRSSGV